MSSCLQTLCKRERPSPVAVIFFGGRADPSLVAFLKEAVLPPLLAIPEFFPHSSATVSIVPAARGLPRVWSGAGRGELLPLPPCCNYCWVPVGIGKPKVIPSYITVTRCRGGVGGEGSRARLWVCTSASTPSSLWPRVGYLPSLSLIHFSIQWGSCRIVLRWEITNAWDTVATQ